ncbi:MAG: hypothetical protein KAJ10_07465 [Thermodesulfovibrionia bacterium]|nr:hypothetical protein [Thermodesulfovibrionia bacterium]
MIKNISITVNSDVLRAFDAARGITKRSTLINELMKNEIAAANGSLLQDNTECGMKQNHRDGGAVDV